MLKIGSVRWRGKCSRHPAFDPGDDGRDAIRGECEKCGRLAEILECHERMLSLMRGFATPRSPKKSGDDFADRQQSLF
ncbi:MAG: hypothetical protein ABJC09_16780 [Terriglobia bacterium]